MSEYSSPEHWGQPTFDLYAATVSAAAAAWPLVGLGDKNAVDRAAVDAMRASLLGANFGGTVVIGEGEKDEAPMLYTGELIGQGQPLDWDIAVDPIDGTALAAAGLPGAVSVMAASARSTMMRAPEVYYMKKIVTGGIGRGVVSLEASPTDNIIALAAAMDKPVSALNVAVINKARNLDVIAEVQASGANWVRFDEGDVAMAVAAALDETSVDMLLGVGGNPEGVVTACAVQVLGGFMQGKLVVMTPEQLTLAMDAGHDLDRLHELHELVSGDRHIFVLTGLTDGAFVKGIREDGENLIIQSVVIDTALDEPRLVEVKVPRF